MLRCSQCKVSQPQENFVKASSEKRGRRSSCKVCDKKWREKNITKINKTAKLYRDSHKKQISLRGYKYRRSHKKQISARMRIYKMKNRDIIREKDKQYRKSHRQQINEYQRMRRAKQRAEKLKLKQCGKCKDYFSLDDLIDFGPLFCRKDYSIACGMDERTAGVFKRLKTKKVKVDDTEENKERREYMQKRRERTLEEMAFSKFGM